MQMDMMNKIRQSSAKIIVFDVDGTLKDLCAEHSDALCIVLAKLGVRKIRRKIILAINKLAMAMVKVGLLPTNQNMQKILVFVFAVLAGKRIKAFQNEYFLVYKKQLCLFKNVYALLDYFKDNAQIYFATINQQNYNFRECGISEERIMHSGGSFKFKTYSKLLKDIGADKSQVLIVGDNVFDDLLSAKLLKVKCLLVNNYNSKLKNAICKFVNGG